jgi:nicotinamidase-related amidase
MGRPEHFPGDGGPRVLVCLDLQRTQLRPEAPSWEEPRRTATCERLLAHARRAGWHIIHVYRTEVDPHGDGRRSRAVSAPIPGLEPRPSEAVFLRQGASALSHPGFAEIVLAAQGREILVAGFDLRTSGLATALDAFNQGVPLTLLQDAFCASPLGSVEQGVLEGVLWGVVAPFARLARVDAVLPHPADFHSAGDRFAAFANDA